VALVEALRDRVVAPHVKHDPVDADLLGVDVLVIAQPRASAS